MKTARMSGFSFVCRGFRVFISVKFRLKNAQNYTKMYPFSDKFNTKFNTKFNIKSQQLYVIAPPKYFAPSASNCGSRQTKRSR